MNELHGAEIPALSGGAESGHGPLTLMLSMNLIILAFFIMLNSVAQQATLRHGGDSRVAPVREKAGYAHSGPTGVAGGSSKGANLDTPARERQVHDDVRGLVASTLRLDAPVPDADADARRVKLTLAPGQLFVSGKNQLALTGQAQTWLENLTALLNGAARGWQGTLRVEGAGAEVPAEVVLLGQRLGAGGMTALEIGYAPAATGQVVLTLQAPPGVIADRGVERLQQVLGQLPGQLEGLTATPGGGAPTVEERNDVE